MTRCEGEETYVVDGQRLTRPCSAPAAVLARSMREVEGIDGWTRWVRVSDRLTCEAHYVAGTMQHLDGRVTRHAAMAAASASG